MSRLSIWTRSILLGVVAAVTYGIVHDQISVRLSPPYLLEWHPRIVASDDPTVVALAWGVFATWWFGLILGIVLALAATIGKRPPAAWRSVVRAVGGIFAVAAGSALIAYLVARGIGLTLPDSLFGSVYTNLTLEGRRAFSAVAAMHEASYDAAGVATLVAAGTIFWLRSRIRP